MSDEPISVTVCPTLFIAINSEHPLDQGSKQCVGTTYKALPEDVSRGATLLLDDGRIVLWVDQVVGSEVICRVVVGGELSNNKGINRQGGGLSAVALTDKDRRDMKTAAAMEADYVAISFPRSAADVEEARGTDPQGFERDRTPTSERVDNERPGAWLAAKGLVCGLREFPGGVQVPLVR